MSNATSEPQTQNSAGPPARWNSWLGVLFVIFIFFGSQIAAGTLISLYAQIKQLPAGQRLEWVNSSVGAQFAYILIAEALVIGAIYLFLKLNGSRFSDIGLKKPRWADPVYGLAALPLYFVIFLVVAIIVKHFAPGLNIDQAQQLGFDNVSGSAALILTFISLVILPALTEEIMVRGFLYGSLKKALPTLWAALVTSAIFAAAHLPEGGAAGPLYIAALDTFVLSLVLIYLREKTGSLWASITLHALKNGIAFFALFVIHLG